MEDTSALAGAETACQAVRAKYEEHQMSLQGLQSVWEVLGLLRPPVVMPTSECRIVEKEAEAAASEKESTASCRKVQVDHGQAWEACKQGEEHRMC